MAEITAERLREVLLYDPETGVFRWWVPTSRKSPFRVGKIAGSYHRDGYREIRIDKRLYRAHRLAWLYMTDKWPDLEIDHIDQDGTNNRWFNLRQATRSQNNANSRHCRNKCGFKGIFQNGPSWAAAISPNGRRVYLGSFPTPEAAHAAYVAAVRKYFC